MPSTYDFDKVFSVAAGETLPGDAPGDDRTDAALRTREQEYAEAADLSWLLESDEPGPEPEIADADETTMMGLAGAAISDVATAAGEPTAWLVGGVRDAAQSILDFGDWASEATGTGGLQIFDESGAFSPDILSGDELAAKREAGVGFSLPEVAEPKSTTGGALRSVTQFLSGFGPAGKVIGGLRGASAAGTATRSAAAGALTDFAAFDAHEERLSDLVQSVPALANPVNEYLSADKSDGEIEGRLKNAAEGLGLGMAAEGLVRGLRVYRHMRDAARSEKGPQNLAAAMRFAEEERIVREAGNLSAIGDASADAPLLSGRQLSGKRLAAHNKGTAADRETELPVPADVAARALTPKGLTPIAGAGDVYVNFAKIETPEDIQRIIKDTSTAFSGSIDDARRGVRTNEQTKLAADKIDAWDVLMSRRKGDPLNAEQSVAARQLWATAADKLGEVADLAASNPSPENLFQFQRMMATFHAVQKEVIAARSETARALQSWAIPTGGNLERMRDMTEALARHGGAGTAEFLARRVAQLSKMDGGAQALSTFVDKSLFAKSLGSVQEYWINALLSGPKTHMVNMMSNAAIIGVSVLERGAAAKFGRAFSDLSGVEAGEAMAQIQGIRGGIIDAFRNAGKALRTGQTGFGMNKVEMPRQRYLSSGTWNVRSDSWLGRGVDGIGAVVNVPGKMLQGEDEFFKTIGYRMEMHAQAQRIASRELQSGKITKAEMPQRIADILDDPPEAVRMEAVATAAYQTFTSEPGKFVQKVQSMTGDYPVLKFVMPFINTPANILKYTFERTPLAPLSPKYRAAIARGGADADLARTRVALGTMGLMFGIEMGLNGTISGSGPTADNSERQNWRRQGNQPYSVKIGDKRIAFNRLDPLGFHLGMSGDIAEYVLNAPGDEPTATDIEDAMAATVFAIAENITSKSYMQGLSLLMEAVNEPDRFAASYFEKFAGSFVPASVAEVARFNDPVMRASSDIVSAVKRRLPAFSEDVPPVRDLWGRAVKYQSGFGAGFDAISPLYGSTYDPEPIDRLMEEDGWFIGMGGYTFTVDGERVSLKNRPDIKSRFYELRGATKPSAMGAEGLIDLYGDNTLLETLNGAVTGKHWTADMLREQRTPEDREDYVKAIVRDYYEAAKDKLFEEFPDIEEMAQRKKAARR